MTHKCQHSTVRIPHPWSVCRLGSSHPFLQDSEISTEFLLPFSSQLCAHQRHHHRLPAEHPCYSPAHTCHNWTALLRSEGLAEQDTEGEKARSSWPQATPDSACVLRFCPYSWPWGFKYQGRFVWYHLIMFVSWRALGKTTPRPLYFTKANLHLCLQKTSRITRIAKSMLLPWKGKFTHHTVEARYPSCHSGDKFLTKRRSLKGV